MGKEPVAIGGAEGVGRDGGRVPAGPGVWVRVCKCACARMCVCMCVREREFRESRREGERETSCPHRLARALQIPSGRVG